MAFSPLFFDLRCRRNTLCVRGPRHPGLCRPIASHARCVSRILAMYTSTHKYQRVTQFLVQYEDDSRALAAWEPAAAVLDDVAVAAYRAAVKRLKSENDDLRERGEAVPSDEYDTEVLLPLPSMARMTMMVAAAAAAPAEPQKADKGKKEEVVAL